MVDTIYLDALETIHTVVVDVFQTMNVRCRSPTGIVRFLLISCEPSQNFHAHHVVNCTTDVHFMMKRFAETRKHLPKAPQLRSDAPPASAINALMINVYPSSSFATPGMYQLG
jgi:hypothetical protein